MGVNEVCINIMVTVLFYSLYVVVVVKFGSCPAKDG